MYEGIQHVQMYSQTTHQDDIQNVPLKLETRGIRQASNSCWTEKARLTVFLVYSHAGKLMM